MGRVSDIYMVNETYREDSAFNHLRPGKLIEGEGDPDKPRAFILGDMPGSTDVVTGRPFVGGIGTVLRQLMELADFHSYFSKGVQYQPNCWLTCVLKYRTPSGRIPNWDEVQACRPYIRQEWQAVNRPKLIIPIGAVALSTIMGDTTRSILKSAGFPFLRQARKGTWLRIWPMLHPRYGLAHPEAQPLMEMHWTKLGEWLDNHKRHAQR